jgi:hypothetical protein
MGIVSRDSTVVSATEAGEPATETGETATETGETATEADVSGTGENAARLIEPHLPNLPAEVSEKKKGTWKDLRYYDERRKVEYVITVEKEKGEYTAVRVSKRSGVSKKEIREQKHREALYRVIAAYDENAVLDDLVDLLSETVTAESGTVTAESGEERRAFDFDFREDKKKLKAAVAVLERYGQRMYSKGIVATCKAAKIEPDFMRFHKELTEEVEKANKQ